MPTEPLFQSIASDTDALIEIEFDGRPLLVQGDCSVAAALLSAGVLRTRSTPVSAAPRAPYCMMGVCFECLLEIDGVANRQACLVPVRPGMKLHSQEGARSWHTRPAQGATGNSHAA